MSTLSVTPRCALLVLLSWTAAGCATMGDPAEAPVGCYQFAWDADAKALGLPWGVELFDDALDGYSALPDARLAVTRLRATVQADHPFGFWRFLESGAVQIGYPAMGAIELELRLVGYDLLGTGRSVGDLVGFDQAPPVRTARPVTAYRVLCPELDAS